MFSLSYHKRADVKLDSSQMRGNLSGKTVGRVSKQAFRRNVPEKDGEKPVGKVVILTDKGSNSGIYFQIKKPVLVFKHPLNSKEETKRMAP